MRYRLWSLVDAAAVSVFTTTATPTAPGGPLTGTLFSFTVYLAPGKVQTVAVATHASRTACAMPGPVPPRAPACRAKPRRDGCDQTSSSTQTGAWSEGFAPSRVSRSTPAPRSRSAACGLSRAWSMRMPWFLSQPFP